MKNRSFQLFGTFILLIGLILVLPGFGQYREYYLYGKVLDTQKNPLEGVEITLRDVNTNRSYTIKTKKGGEFKFAGVPHGIYKVVFKKEGYAVKEDEWRFTTPQDKMQKMEIPPVVLVSEAQVQEQAYWNEMQAEVKEVAEKIKQNDFDGAISLSKKALEKNPKDPNALYLLGISYARKKMYPEAVDSLTQVTLLNSDFPPAYFELGVCYQQQNDPDRALEYYQKNLVLDPANVDSAYNSGLILFAMNRIDEALPLFEQALSLKTDDPAFLEMAGRCYINQADFGKAIEYLEKAKAGYTDQEKIKFLDDLIAKLKEQIKK
ncbi:MAG: tetratricopeptide repeat protein [Candidatus Aminicenantes bacterium]|nr:tetratricopeptide repeat protein [Candidatus Aminicenantes bacterium]MDH5742616.1 tetratricopeptide repeat protein [Candidatus Aminicenantes bacterium]